MWQNQKIVITGVTLEKLTRGKMMNLKVRTGDRTLDSFTLMMYRVKEGHFKLVKSFCKVKSEHKPSHVLSSLLRFLSGFCTTPLPPPPPKKKIANIVFNRFPRQSTDTHLYYSMEWDLGE